MTCSCGYFLQRASLTEAEIDENGLLGYEWRLLSPNQRRDAASASPASLTLLAVLWRAGFVLILMTAEETAAHLCGPPDTWSRGEMRPQQPLWRREGKGAGNTRSSLRALIRLLLDLILFLHSHAEAACFFFFCGGGKTRTGFSSTAWT